MTLFVHSELMHSVIEASYREALPHPVAKNFRKNRGAFLDQDLLGREERIMSLTDLRDRLWRVRKQPMMIIGLVLIAFLLGYMVAGPRGEKVTQVAHQESPAQVANHDHQKEPPQSKDKKPTIWTCSMHPQIRLPNPGKCPICFMDLIPLETDKETESEAASTQFSMSEAAKKLSEVETAEVKRDRAKVLVRMVGMVYENESRVAALTARVDGRLDELYVTYTGELVRQGDPMVKIWSPTLIRSQVDLFETLKSSQPDEDVIKGSEEKLIQQGFTREQVEELKQKRKPNLYVTLRAPINGIVMRKNAFIGQFVKEGTEMFMINDLSVVWVKMDAYETDMPWIRYGQNVIFTTPAVPGREFKGKVLFIDPTLDTKTRSVKIRVEAENPDFLLKPGMFVTAELESEVDHLGRVIKPEWAGKYICPVHPREEASDEPGICPDSKMPLRPAASFGYLDEKNPVFPLVIPSSAPLITGKRAIVYVEVPNRDRPTYEGREIVLGPRAGDKYVVFQGLKEGEKVVTKGNFKIDSAMQLLARPSMMRPPEVKESQAGAKPAQPEEEVVERLHVPEEFLSSLTPLVNEYLNIKEALVDEKTEDAAKGAAGLEKQLHEVKASLLDETSAQAWLKLSRTIVDKAQVLSEAKEIAAQRRAFDPLSEAFVRMLMSFRHVTKGPLVVFHCPMAFEGQGAYWVEAGEERRNPYYGRKPFKGQDMLQCGELIERIPPENAGGGEKSSTEVRPPGQGKSASGSGPARSETGSGPAPRDHDSLSTEKRGGK